MMTKEKLSKKVIALAIIVVLLLGILPMSSKKVSAANIDVVKKASARTLLTREDLATLGNGQTYKLNGSFQFASFQDRRWLMAGGINDEYTGGKDGLVLWSENSVGKDEYRPGGSFFSGFTYQNSGLQNRLNSDEEKFQASYNINKLFTKAAKSLVLPVTAENWNCAQRAYNNYLYIPDRTSSRNGIFLGLRYDQFIITLDEYTQIRKKAKNYEQIWLRTQQGTGAFFCAMCYEAKYSSSYIDTLLCYDIINDFTSYADLIPSFVLDLSKTVLASTAPEASSLSKGKHDLKAGTMNFRFANEEKIKSTIEYTNDYMNIKKNSTDWGVYLCVQYSTGDTYDVFSFDHDEIYTKELTGSEVLTPEDLGINTFEGCTVWLERKDYTDKLLYAKEGTYYQAPTVKYTSYGKTEEFTPGVQGTQVLGSVSAGGFAPSFKSDYTVQIFDDEKKPASDDMQAVIDNGELVVTNKKDTNPGTYYLRIKAYNKTDEVYSEYIPVTVGRLDHVQQEKSVAVEADSEGTYTTTLYWPAEGADYQTPKTEGTIKATDINIDASGNDKKITFSVPACADGSSGKIIIPVSGGKKYNDYNIVINLTAYGKTVTYWTKEDLEDFGKGKTYYVSAGKLQRASFAGREWYAIGTEKNANTKNKKGLVLLSASSVCTQQFNPSQPDYLAADYASSVLNKTMNSGEDAYKVKDCNVYKLFTEEERNNILPVDVNYSWIDTSSASNPRVTKTASNVLLYVPDKSSDDNLNQHMVLGAKDAFIIQISEARKQGEGFCWYRSKKASQELYTASSSSVSSAYMYSAGCVVPEFDLDLSKVFFASAAPCASSEGTSDVVPNDTMVFRFKDAEKLKSAITPGEDNQTFDITKSNEDTQPVYLCAQYNTVSGVKIYTRLITETCTVDLNKIVSGASDINVWLETTSAGGRMVYAKKATPVLSYTAVEPSPELYSDTEDIVTLGTIGVKGYSAKDIKYTLAVYESAEEDAAQVTDGSIRAYIEDGKLCVNTTTQVKEGTYCIRVSAASDDFKESLTSDITVKVGKRVYSPPVLSRGIPEGTDSYTIKGYSPKGGGTLGDPLYSGDLSISDVSVVKKYSVYSISFTATDAKAGQTGTITIPVTGGTGVNDYNLVVSVICSDNKLTWYTSDTLKSLGSSGVCFTGGSNILKAKYVGRTWGVFGAENNANTGNRDTLVMVSLGPVADAGFNELEKGSNYGNSLVYNVMNSSNSAYANLDGNAHKIFGSAIKYVVPVKVNYTCDNGGTSTSVGNYLYLLDGDSGVPIIKAGTSGSYSVTFNTFKKNVYLGAGSSSGFFWLRSAAKLNYVSSIIYATEIGERFMIAKGGMIIPEFNLDLQNVLFASPASASGAGNASIDLNSDIIFRFRDSASFDGKVYYNGEGKTVSVVLDKTYTDPVYLCVQYSEDGIEKLYSVPVTSSGSIDLTDHVKADLSTAHIWVEMTDSLSSIVYATLSAEGEHKHSWQYGVSEDGKSLEAWCTTTESGNCEHGLKNKLSLTLETADGMYSGAAYRAYVTGTEEWVKLFGGEAPAINYVGTGETSYDSDQPPVNAGTYMAQISAGGVTASAEFTISKKQLTVTGTSVNDKVYDKSTAAAVNAGSVSGIIDGDDVKVGTTGTFSDANSGENKTVTVKYTLSGEGAVNYTAPEEETLTANITKKDIRVFADSVSSKVNDNTTPLTFTSDILCEGDVFEGALSTDPASIDKTSAGVYTITQGTLSAGDNYNIIFTGGTYTVSAKKTREISFEEPQPAPESAENESEVKKTETEEPKTSETEDQKQKEEEPVLMAPILVKTETPPPAIENGNITITYGQYSEFTRTIVQTGITVTYSSSNPEVATVDESTGKVTVLKAGTTAIKAIAAATSEYEKAETSYTLTVLKQPVSIPEVITKLIYNGEEQTGITADDGTIFTKSGNVGTNAGEYTCTLTLKDKDNYIWNTAAPTTEDRNLKWNIGKKRLSVTGSTADKEYDGSARTVVTVGDVTGVIEKAGVKEKVTVTAEGVFDRPNVAKNKKAWIDYSLTGDDADNYLAPFSELITAKITPKKLSISGTSVADKVYDGTRSAVAACGTLSGKILVDDVAALGWAAFTDKNAGKHKDVIVVYTLIGEQAGNYEAPDTEILYADITPATVNVEAENQAGFVKNERMPLRYFSDELFAGDSFSGELDTNADTRKVGIYSITQGTLSAGDNYIINFTNGKYYVEKKFSQKITFENIENNTLSKTYGDADYENVVSGARTDVVLTSSNEKVAVIDGMKVKIVGPGTAVITALAQEDNQHESAEAKYTLTVKAGTTPETGDHNNMALYIFLLSASAVVISLMVLYRKKINR